jgi:hypothetical protein
MSAVSTITSVQNQKVELVAADTALLSLRSSGHDYCSAVGEVIDNSLQANANNVRCRIFTDKEKVGKNKKATEVVSRVAIGDDGDGMDRLTLHNSLKLGYSTRYNSRTGMGRFGVGAKMGGISQARRIDIHSRQSPDAPWLHTYIDLDEVSGGTMEFIPSPDNVQLPADCADLVGEKGTLVVWSKTDRLAQAESGGGRRPDTVKSDLVPYIARVFREFLDGGITIEFDGKKVFPHDPLFLMTSTRFHQNGESDPTAEIKVQESFEWEIPGDAGRKSTVYVTLTLLPKEWRSNLPGDGRTKAANERRLYDNEGLSILRADREIFYGVLAGVQPPKKEIDRFIGKQIAFEPALDECFQVRNVKKGAEPIDGLRDKIREIIGRTIEETLRREITTHHQNVEKQRLQDGGLHAEAEQVAAETQRTARKPKAGKDTPQETRDKQIDEAATALTKEVPESQREQKKAQVKAKIENQPITMIPETWPGKEFIDIKHLGSNSLVRLNMQHPFYTDVYAKLVAAEKTDGDEKTKELAGVIRLGIDLLIMGYARAEGQYEDSVIAQFFDSFKTNWGLEVRDLIQHWATKQ